MLSFERFVNRVFSKLLSSDSMESEVNEMSNEIVGLNIRLTEILAERGIKQADLCRLTGLASSMISHYCTGQRIPSVPTIVKIAEALGTTVDYLSFGDSSKAKHGMSLTPSFEYGNDEQFLIDMFRALNTKGQIKVIAYTEDLLSTGKYK